MNSIKTTGQLRRRYLAGAAAVTLAGTGLLVALPAGAGQDASGAGEAATHDHATHDHAAHDHAAHDHAAHDHAAHDHAAHTLSQDELAQVRKATARFHRVGEAVAAGYELGWVNGSGARIVAGCVSHPTAGAMGYHYFNAELMADNDVNALEPEVLVYAPAPDGELKLVAVEWVVRGPQSNPPGVSETPSVLGMEMHILVPPPGPAFYLTHAWVWAHNPNGMFADWNPEITCS